MLEKVSADDVSLYQSYTIRRLDAKQTTMPDTEHYKLINVNENAMSRYLDVLCFPTLFPSGKFGEHHSRKNVSIYNTQSAAVAHAPILIGGATYIHTNIR